MLVSTKRCKPLLLSSSQVKCTLTLRRSDPFCSAADRTKGKEANGVENKRRDWRECRESKARCMYFAYSVHASWQQRKLRTCSDKSVYGIWTEKRKSLFLFRGDTPKIYYSNFIRLWKVRKNYFTRDNDNGGKATTVNIAKLQSIFHILRSVEWLHYCACTFFPNSSPLCSITHFRASPSLGGFCSKEMWERL